MILQTGMRSKRNPTRFSYSTGASRIFSGSTDSDRHIRDWWYNNPISSHVRTIFKISNHFYNNHSFFIISETEEKMDILDVSVGEAGIIG